MRNVVGTEALARRTAVVASVLAFLLLVPHSAATPVSTGPEFVVPLDAPLRVATPFDPPAQRWLAGHRGVDLAVPPLTNVLAPADGVVSFAGPVAGRPVLSLDHGDGLRTTYEPVRATVDVGEVVTTGQPVGHLMAGHPGCPAQACLHWGARVAAGGPSGDDDEYVDPLGLLSQDLQPIRLKPLHVGDG